MTSIVDVPAFAYHADQVGGERTRFSKSIGHVLLTQSPRHAWAAHPKLNPAWEYDDEGKYDVGTAAHAMLLEGDETNVHVVAAKDWRTKAAQEQRDLARAAGKTPLLAGTFDEARRMVDAARAQLAEIDPTIFADGIAERSLLFDLDGVACKCRCDWIDDVPPLRRIVDYKTTSGSAAPEAWTTNRLYDIGGDLQAALYLRGLEAVREDAGMPREPLSFLFVVQETRAPYALSVIAPGPDVLELANQKLDYALAVWRRCLESGDWPAYPTQIVRAKLPPWQESRWYEREDRDAVEAAA